MAECKYLREPAEAGPACSCSGTACALGYNAAQLPEGWPGGRPVEEAGECPKCYDPRFGINTGIWHYDENHGSPCDLCCPHDGGWWLLQRHYGADNGRYSCKRGCGQTRSGEELFKHLQPEGAKQAARARGARRLLRNARPLG